VKCLISQNQENRVQIFHGCQVQHTVHTGTSTGVDLLSKDDVNNKQYSFDRILWLELTLRWKSEMGAYGTNRSLLIVIKTTYTPLL